MMVASNLFTVRPMREAELDFALTAANREGWNPGLQDAASFYQADPHGFLLGMLGDRPVGCISAVSYPGGFGFIGLYIVLPEYRGQGYGLRLWRAAVERLAGHNIGLDGVPAQQDNYRTSGFTLAYRNVRYEGRAGTGRGNVNTLTDGRAVRFEQLCTYDRECFPAERRAFLAAWLRTPGTTAFAQVEAGRLRGYGVIRPCAKGWKIGPLFADDEARADVVFRGLCARVAADDVIYLDVPAINPAAVALAERHGMRPVFETARMYTGAAPAVDTGKTFGVTTFELG